jgi:hypothetical protein
MSDCNLIGELDFKDKLGFTGLRFFISEFSLSGSEKDNLPHFRVV